MTASADFCIKVAEVMEVSPEMLLRLAGILPPAPPVLTSDNSTLKEIIEFARNLSSEQQEEVLRYIRYLYQSGH